jgi:hypothetical protein
MGYFQYTNAQYAAGFQKLKENHELILDIDFAKTIESNLVESGIEIFKLNGKNYANK